MKRLFSTLSIVSILLFLASCDEVKPYKFSVTNASETNKTVSYTYGGKSYTLAVGGKENYVEERGNNGASPKNVVDDSNEVASLKTVFENGGYVFKDATPLVLKVINMLSVPVTIKADSFIDNNSGSPNSTELTIPANNEITDAKIYTKTPKFTTTTNYPIKVEYKIVGNEMAVIIR